MEEMTVLVADDFAPLRAATRDILEAEGHRVLEAANGAVALQVIANEDVDVVVLDLHMPVCDGLEVLRQLDAPPPKVIVVSGFETISRPEVETFGDKVSCFLTKPVHPAALLTAVANALDA